MNNVLIFGASGHGSVILDSLERSGIYTPVGFVDSFKKKGTKKNGYEVLGSEYDLPLLIDAHSVVGACSLVVDDIPDQVVAFGSPARIIRSREPSEPYLSGNRIENSVQLRLDYFGS
jgi:hypothetical protein